MFNNNDIVVGGGRGRYGMTGISSSREDIAQNIFYPRLANIATEVCSSCPLGVCPFGKFRPAMSEGGLCGPPCGLLGK
jgi:hypothetical protein